MSLGAAAGEWQVAVVSGTGLDRAIDASPRSMTAARGRPSDGRPPSAPGVFALGEVLRDAMNRTRERWRDGDRFLGLPSGLEDLDDILGGLEPGTLTVVGSASRAVVEAFAATVTLSTALKQRAQVLYCTKVVSRSDLAARLATAHAGIPWAAVRTGRLSDDGWERLSWAADQLADAPVWISDAPTMSVEALQQTIGSTGMSSSGFDLVLIDQLRASAFPGHSGISAASALPLKDLAVAHQVAIVALAPATWTVPLDAHGQVSVGGLADPEHLAEAADAIVLFHDSVPSTGGEVRRTAAFDVAMNRFGVVGTGEVAFLRESGRLANLDRSTAS